MDESEDESLASAESSDVVGELPKEAPVDLKSVPPGVSRAVLAARSAGPGKPLAAGEVRPVSLHAGTSLPSILEVSLVRPSAPSSR